MAYLETVTTVSLHKNLELNLIVDEKSIACSTTAILIGYGRISRNYCKVNIETQYTRDSYKSLDPIRLIRRINDLLHM